MNLRDMDLEYLITARGDDVLRYQDKADMSDSEAERRKLALVTRSGLDVKPRECGLFDHQRARWCWPFDSLI